MILNGIDLEPFERARSSATRTLRKDIGASQDSILACAIGRITPDKGFDYFVESAAHVLRRADAHFLIVGPSQDLEFEQVLRARIDALAIREKVHFLGFREDIPAILAESDVFALPSRTEGHPIILLEAMASGCGIVAHKCEGVAETLDDGISGYVVGIGDTAAMAERILQLGLQPDLRRTMASAAQHVVRQRFSVHNSVQQVVSVYEEVLAMPRPAAGSLAIAALLQVAEEIGSLGLRVMALEERLRQVEHLARLVKENAIARMARRIKHALWKA